MNPTLFFRTLGVLFLASALSVSAHRGVHEQLEALNERIRLDPKNAGLYLERAELHRLHSEWKEARADYDRAAQLDPKLEMVEFARGRMLLESGDPAAAKPFLDRFLARNPNHSDARLSRARTLVSLDRAADAIADYDVAIAHSPRLTPDLYHERAKVLADLGRTDDALRALDDGLTRLGVIASLQQQAIEIELRVERYEQALARLETLTRQAQRKESYLARKGDILTLAGRTEEARAAYEEALACIAALPPAKRNAATTRELHAHVTKALAK